VKQIEAILWLDIAKERVRVIVEDFLEGKQFVFNHLFRHKTKAIRDKAQAK
jgi:hypothetical protein